MTTDGAGASDEQQSDVDRAAEDGERAFQEHRAKAESERLEKRLAAPRPWGVRDKCIAAGLFVGAVFVKAYLDTIWGLLPLIMYMGARQSAAKSWDEEHRKQDVGHHSGSGREPSPSRDHVQTETAESRND